MSKLIFGCGYLGLRVARLWLAEGETVWAVTRSAQRAALLAAEGIRPLIADVAEETTLPALALPTDLETVLFAIGYDRTSGRSIQQVYVDGLGRALARLPKLSGALIYISSTGVYGNGAGDWVDETSVCQPTREGGRACLAAEQLLQASEQRDRAIILRLAGIYGPGRIPRAGDLRAGAPIDAPEHGYLNLIHLDDAARIVLLAEKNSPRPRTYVVSDGAPVVRGAYYRELAALLGAPLPRFVAPPSDSPAALRAASDKRINPARLMHDLAPRLLYPSYREGLRAICC